MALRENPELCKSYVREPCQLGPIQATQKPSLEASLEESKPQTEDPVPSTLSPASAPPPPYKPLYPFVPEVQPELLFLLQEVVGGPQGITRVHTPFSLSDLNLCHLGRFSGFPSWFTGEFQGRTLSFDLTWKKLNVLSHCYTTEEKTRISAQAQTCADRLHVTQPHQNPVGMTAIPLMDPSWDYQPGQPVITKRDHMILCLTEGVK